MLNKETSKLLLQIGKALIVYSFDQKRIIVGEVLRNEPCSVLFQTDSDFILLAYRSGLIELRKLPSFQNIIKKYNHYEEMSSVNKNVCDIVVETVWSEGTPVIISGGENGILRLERIAEFV